MVPSWMPLVSKRLVRALKASAMAKAMPELASGRTALRLTARQVSRRVLISPVEEDLALPARAALPLGAAGGSLAPATVLLIEETGTNFSIQMPVGALSSFCLSSSTASRDSRSWEQRLAQ